MSTLLAVASSSIHKAACTLSAVPDETHPDGWSVVPTTLGAVAACVYRVDVVGSSATVYFSPALSPTATYNLTATTTTGGANTVSVVAFTLSAEDKPQAVEWSHGALAAWSRAIAQTIHEFTGTPTTRLSQDLTPASTVLFVESTLGFPATGYVFVGVDRYRYTGKGSSCFTGLTRDTSTTQIEPRRQIVVLDTASVWPTNAYPYIRSQRAYPDLDGVL